MNRPAWRSDRGAVATVVALLAVVLLGSAAVSVDVAASYAARRALQNGADAAALAVAQESRCSPSPTSTSTAQTLAAANATGTRAAASAPVFRPGSVTVAVHAVGEDGQPGRPNWFAPVLGEEFARSAIETTATAGCSRPRAGTAALPLTFHECHFVVPPATSGPTIIGFNTTSTRCNGTSGNAAPGNFGWLDGTGAGCPATIDPDDSFTPGDTGINIPTPCKPTLAELRGAVALIPMYDQVTGTGSSVEFHITGFAAFRITGYRFSGNPEFNWRNDIAGQPSCTGNCRAIIGTFVSTVRLDQATFTPGGADFGVTVVSLTG